MDLEIKFGDLDDMTKEIKEVLKNPRIAEELPETTVYLKPDVIPKIFSKERIKLLKEVKEEKKNVSELSKKLKRKIENISRDLNCLHEYGLIDFKRKGKEKIPVIVRDRVVIGI